MSLPYTSEASLTIPGMKIDVESEKVFGHVNNNIMFPPINNNQNSSSSDRNENSNKAGNPPKDIQGNTTDYSFRTNMDSQEGGVNLGRIDTGNGVGNGNGQSSTSITINFIT